MNLGNTCYLNAVVQSLAHCAPFSAALTGDAGSLDGSDKDAKLSRAVAQLCSALHERGSAVRPADLIKAIQARRPSFSGFRQQDAHELLCLLLEGLHVHLERHWASANPAGAEAEGMVVDGCQPDEAAQTDAPVREASETQPHPAEVLVLCQPAEEEAAEAAGGGAEEEAAEAAEEAAEEAEEEAEAAEAAAGPGAESGAGRSALEMPAAPELPPQVIVPRGPPPATATGES